MYQVNIFAEMKNLGSAEGSSEPDDCCPALRHHRKGWWEREAVLGHKIKRGKKQLLVPARRICNQARPHTSSPDNPGDTHTDKLPMLSRLLSSFVDSHRNQMSLATERR